VPRPLVPVLALCLAALAGCRSAASREVDARLDKAEKRLDQAEARLKELQGKSPPEKAKLLPAVLEDLEEAGEQIGGIQRDAIEGRHLERIKGLLRRAQEQQEQVWAAQDAIRDFLDQERKKGKKGPGR
jgi:hypothetical protein